MIKTERWIMIESIRDIPVSPQLRGVKPQNHDSLIDTKDLKGILFLGVKGDISAIVDSNKVDILV